MFGNHDRWSTGPRNLLLITAAGLFACADPANGGRAEAAKGDEAKAETGADPDSSAEKAGGEGEKKKRDPGDPRTKPPEGPLGKMEAGLTLSFGDLLGRSQEEVAAKLGEPRESGKGRITCVRHQPERVFFACEVLVARYDDPNKKLETIQVEFEDGKAARVGYAGLPGEGEFDPAAALKLVGLELPGDYKHNQPTEVISEDPVVVDVYSYFNSSARLLHEGYEHRVEVSVVDKKWERAKVEVINNHPLNADQRARIKESKNPPAAPAEPANSSEMPPEPG